VVDTGIFAGRGDDMWNGLLRRFEASRYGQSEERRDVYRTIAEASVSGRGSIDRPPRSGGGGIQVMVLQVADPNGQLGHGQKGGRCMKGGRCANGTRHEPRSIQALTLLCVDLMPKKALRDG
jgi:hypothetical protein